MYTRHVKIVIAGLMMFVFFATGYALSGQDVAIKQANKIIRTAERKMHSGKNSEADELLTEASALIEQVKSEEPGNKKITTLEKKYSRIRKNVDKKLAEATGTSTTAAPLTTGPKSNVNKLPGGVKKRLKDISRYLDKAEQYIGSDAKNAKYQLEQADRLFSEIDKNYSSKFNPKHPDFSTEKNRYKTLTIAAKKQDSAEAEALASEAGTKAAMVKQSAEWVTQFSSYLAYPGQEGHNPELLVFVPGTSEPEKFSDARKRYENFKTFYQKYKQTQFPNGKTWKLEDLADNQAPIRLKDFEEGISSRIASVSGGAEKEINAAMDQLQKDNGWRSDKKIKPNLLDQRRMSTIREATEKVISALGASDPKRKQIQAKFDALVKKDQENRQIRKERTFMTPDQYTGSDSEVLKAMATSLVEKNTKEGGKPLRCTIISKGWQEQTIKEWTDTSKTTWRIRTTRSLTAQVAAKTAGGVRLITVALAKDKQSDGGWGALYGNLHQYSDPMLEENVNK